MPLRIVFMGTADLAGASLHALLASQEFAVVGTVTRPDRPRGREWRARPPIIKTISEKAGFPLLQPESAGDPAFVAALRALRPEVIVVAAYGQILPPSVLELPAFGCVNVHASLLPKYRGAAPIQWAILNGETETGVSIMKMTAGLDRGDVLSRRATPLGPDETAAALRDRLAAMGAELLVVTLPPYVAGAVRPQAQDETAATYARKITKEDGLMDWTQPALALRNRIRAFTPWPGAFGYWAARGERRLLKFWRAQVELRQGPAGEVLQADRTRLVVGCGTDALRVEQLQLEGGRKMTAAEFLAGHDIKPGTRID
jgi:methionyl-tRNA formyltransferase